jgi:hypothetical protein
MLMSEQQLMEGMRLRKKYYDEFCPMINKKDYNRAFEYLLKNPEMKNYLAPSDIFSMYNFLESKLCELTSLEVSEVKLETGDEE